MDTPTLLKRFTQTQIQIWDDYFFPRPLYKLRLLILAPFLGLQILPF